jgi:hypothetical protein
MTMRIAQLSAFGACLIATGMLLPSSQLQAQTANHRTEVANTRTTTCTDANYTIARGTDGEIESYTSKRSGLRFARYVGQSELYKCAIGDNGEEVSYVSDTAYATAERCNALIMFRYFPGFGTQLKAVIDGSAEQWRASTSDKPVAPPDVREAVIPVPGRKLSVYQASVKTDGPTLGPRGKLLLGYSTSANALVQMSAAHPDDAFCGSAKQEIGAFIGKFPWP